MMNLILLISGVLLNILPAQSQPQWINHNGFWYMYVGPQPPAGAQPPSAAQLQQQPRQQQHNPASKGVIRHSNPTGYKANPGPPIIKSLPALRPAPPIPIPPPPIPGPSPPRAPPGNTMLPRQQVPYLQPSSGMYAPHRYPAFPNAIDFPRPLQRPAQQRVPAAPPVQIQRPAQQNPVQPLASPPQPQPAIRNWGPVQIWNPAAVTPGYQHPSANHVRHGPVHGPVRGPVHGPVHGPVRGPVHGPQPSIGYAPHSNIGHAPQPNMYPPRHPPPYQPGPPHSVYPGGLSPYGRMEGPDVDLVLTACGASALIVTTPAVAGAAAAEPRCRCEDPQDCDTYVPSNEPTDPLCPLWSTCCCQALPPTVAPPPGPTAAPAAG